MRISIVGRHMTVTPALRRYIETRVRRLERFGASAVEAQVILTVEKYRHTAEIVLSGKGAVIQGKVSTGEMYGSVDRLIDKISRQVLKRKEKRVEHKPRAAAKRAAPSQAVPEYRTSRPAVRHLSRDEALEQLRSQAADLFIYRDADTKEIQIFRRLADGVVEHIEPRPE